MALAAQRVAGKAIGSHISYMKFMYVQKLLCINRTHLANLRAESKYLTKRTFEYLVWLYCNSVKLAAAHKFQELDTVSAMSADQQKWEFVGTLTARTEHTVASHFTTAEYLNPLKHRVLNS